MLWSLLLTFLVFLVLPLTQMISGRVNESKNLVDVNAFAPPPPPPPVEPPTPEEEEPEPEPEELQEDQSMPPMSLSQLELALDGGMGSGVGDFGLGFQTASNLVAAIDVFELSEVDKGPVRTMAVPPKYPPKLQREKIEGTVVLTFVLDERGRVQNPRVENSTDPAFEKAALDAVKQWMFEPAVKDGKPVRARLRQPISFSLG